MKVLFIQPSLQPPGGGNGVAVWMLQSLADRGPVTVLTWVPVDLDAVDAYFGTRLKGAELTFICRRAPFSSWLTKLGIPHELFKLHFLMAMGRKLAREFDLVCSANNELDFGCPSIQYVHYPWNHHPRPDCDQTWYRNPFLRLILLTYYRVCRLISGHSSASMLGNLTLVNSAWTGRKFQSVYGDHPYRVLYPPALGKFPDRPWEPRRHAFLSVGRQHPTKEWEKLIAIVSGLRQRGHAVELTLAGSRDSQEYRERMLRAIEQAGPWVRLVENLTREELVELAVQHRYGLHGMTEEHYGMAVAELVLAGCLTFAPADGGQVEILGDERLLYTGVEDAIEKLDRALCDDALQQELLHHLGRRRGDLGVERFQREFEACLADHLSATASTAARPGCARPGPRPAALP